MIKSQKIVTRYHPTEDHGTSESRFWAIGNLEIRYQLLSGGQKEYCRVEVFEKEKYGTIHLDLADSLHFPFLLNDDGNEISRKEIEYYKEDVARDKFFKLNQQLYMVRLHRNSVAKILMKCREVK